MAELSELERILNLPDLALEQLWNLMDDEKDQTLKFLIAIFRSDDYEYTEEDNNCENDEDLSYNSTKFQRFINPDTAYARIKLNEDLTSWFMRCALNPGYQSSDLLAHMPKLLDEYVTYIRDYDVLSDRFEEQLLKIIPDHDPRDCTACDKKQKKGQEFMHIIQPFFHEIRRIIEPDENIDDGARRFEDEVGDTFENILWCCPGYFDSVAVAFLKFFRKKIELSDSFESREFWVGSFEEAMYSLRYNVKRGQEWAGTQRLYGEKVFKISPGKDVIRASSVLKKIIENLRLFEPWEHHLVEKIAKKKVSKDTWVENNKDSKKIVFKPWTAEETKMFEEIEDVRLKIAKLPPRRHYIASEGSVQWLIEEKQDVIAMTGKLKEHHDIEKTRRNRTKSSCY
ncbi:unnamed protein product [Oikopleura dioica]|uniref:Uncharacterized protein n=1 Tax=Oikopleura dioica TaxID=34765 RepID=E4XXF5_OIKDI|nr:unnamed protein product [Oikopleura dioica]